MKEDPLHRGQELERLTRHSHLILFNDDHNSFEHVIRSLVEVCGHDEVQAEQCAVIAHFNGKCDVKRGARELLSSMAYDLINRDLTVEIV